MYIVTITQSYNRIEFEYEKLNRAIVLAEEVLNYGGEDVEVKISIKKDEQEVAEDDIS